MTAAVSAGAGEACDAAGSGGARPGICVLDVDGTLLPGSLGFELARHLAASGANVDLAGLRAVMSAFRTGQVDERTMTVASHRIYATGLSGLAVDDVRAAAAEVWQRTSDQVFDYVRPLIGRLRAAGYRVLLISGSPAEMVEAAAADLGAAASFGAQLATAFGRYLPRLVAAPAMPGGKSRALRMLTGGGPVGPLTAGVQAAGSRAAGMQGGAQAGAQAGTLTVDGPTPPQPAPEVPTCTLALGNTRRDTEILRRVRHPFAFEPDRALARAAAAHGWPVVDRDDALERVGRVAHCTGGAR